MDGHQTVTLALPDATVGAMPARGGADAITADAATRERLVELELGGPWRQADTMSYDEIVHPDDLRQALMDSLRLASNRHASRSMIRRRPAAGGLYLAVFIALGPVAQPARSVAHVPA